MSILPLLKFDIRPVPSLPGVFISDEGVAYRREKGNAKLFHPRKATLAKCGYYVVSSRNHLGRSIPRYIHRLVAEAFLPAPAENHEVRHLDGTRTNNRPPNLTWGTRLQNVEDMIGHGRLRRGVDAPGAKLSELDVQVIRYLVKRGASIYSICPVFGLTHSAVADIRDGKSWSHLPDVDFALGD